MFDDSFCLFSNSGSDLNSACQCLKLDFYQRTTGPIVFFSCVFSQEICLNGNIS